MSSVVRDDASGTQAPQINRYSAISGYCLAVNYIIGVGVLGMPNAFAQSGILLSIIMLIFNTCVMFLTAVWVVEASARCDACKLAKDPSNHIDGRNPDTFLLTTNRYEYNDIMGEFAGRYGRVMLTIILGLNIYVSLWSYGVIFGSSTLVIVPIPGISDGMTCDLYANDVPVQCKSSYYIYIFIFFLVVLPISCMDLGEQVIVQGVLTFFRFLVAFLLSLTTLIAMYNSQYTPGASESPPFVEKNDLFNFARFGYILPTTVFAQQMHHSIPSLIQPLRSKKRVREMFASAMATTFAIYAIISVPVSLYFGNKVSPIASLRWNEYSGTGFMGSYYSGAFVRVIAIIVVMFPPIDIISAFPLNAVVLANTILSAMPKSVDKTSFMPKFLSRLAAVIPPLILGAFIYRFDLIIEIGGMLGFLITLVTPALMLILSKRRCKSELGCSRTPYDTPLSNPKVAYVVLAYGVASTLYQIVSISMRVASKELTM